MAPPPAPYRGYSAAQWLNRPAADSTDLQYYTRALGRLDDDGDAAEDDDDNGPLRSRSHLGSSSPYVAGTPTADETGGMGPWLVGPGTGEHLSGHAGATDEAGHDPPPTRVYDVAKRTLTTESDHGSDSSDLLDDNYSSSSEAEADDEGSERFEWQDMLGNVLGGDVLKSEKTRLSGTLAHQLDDPAGQRKHLAGQIWLGVRAFARGRTPEAEQRYLDEARLALETIAQDVMAFQVADGSDVTSAAEQVDTLLARVAWAFSLYPSARSLEERQAAYDDEQFKARIAALQSWTTVTRRLRVHIGILQKWTGSEQLDVVQPGAESLEAERVTPPGPGSGDNAVEAARDRTRRTTRKLIDTSSFVERILKEESFIRTFQKRTITDVYPLVRTAKSTLMENRIVFAELRLPAYTDDLVGLFTFPTSLMHEALKLRLEYVTRVNKEDPSILLIDQLTDDFRSCLELATKMKRDFVDIARPDPEHGWNPADLSENRAEFHSVLLGALHFFFKLINWRLKSNSKAIYLKETDIVEHEWHFLTEVTQWIDGGDLHVAEHFSMLTHRLIQRVVNYFNECVEVLARRQWDANEAGRWFNQTLDNVRLRHRKLMRFGNYMCQQFEQSTEYLLDDIDLNAFVNALAETEHFLIYTGSVELQGIYLIGSPCLHDRADYVKQILKRCYPPPSGRHAQGSAYAPADSPSFEAENGPAPAPRESAYVLVLTPREPFLWTGAVMNLDYRGPELDTHDRRVRIVADGPVTRLHRARQRFIELFPAFETQVVAPTLANFARVNREVKRIKSSQFRLAQAILDSADRIHSTVRNMAGFEGLLAAYYAFASDLGVRTLKSTDERFADRLGPLLMLFGIRWVGFICDDCVPSDGRTFKWAVSALEYVHAATEGDHILKLAPDDFARLRAGVASCMGLLISHFDILGARSNFEARKDREAMETTRAEARRLLVDKLATLKMHNDDSGRVEPDGSIYASSQRISESTRLLDEQRHEIEGEHRLVGRVLDTERPEDRGLLFLASSSSNISMRWQQGRFIGGGTFGQVYLGVKLDTGDLMAVKEIRFQDLASAPQLIKQVRDEMRVMEMLSHPNIVEYYGIEVHRDKVYIFEEYCQGGSLGSLLEHGRIEDESVLQLYTLQLLDGLSYLHSQGVVHRDIKPDNILLDHMGVIKYIDFGAARVLGREKRTIARTRMGASDPAAANSLTGTPSYMAPEVIKGEHKGRQGAMDVWGLGCVVLECATGKRPWGGLDNEWAIMFQIGIAAKPPPLPDETQLSAVGIDFIRQCLTIDANHRPTAVELSEHAWITSFREHLALAYADEMGDQGGSLNSIASSNLTVPLLPTSADASPAGSLDPSAHARPSQPAHALPTVGEEDEDVPMTPDA